MIIENTVDQARLKLMIPKFLKWILFGYTISPRITTYHRGKTTFVMTETFSNLLREKSIEEMTIGFDDNSVGDVPLSGFIMKNYPKYMSIGIDPLKIEVGSVRLYYKQEDREWGFSLNTPKFMPFKYGLELHSDHKGDIDIFRIDKETTAIQMVTYSMSASLKNLEWNYENYTLNQLGEETRMFTTQSSNFHSAVLKLMVAFYRPNIFVGKFTKVLPIEKNITGVIQ